MLIHFQCTFFRILTNSRAARESHFPLPVTCMLFDCKSKDRKINQSYWFSIRTHRDGDSDIGIKDNVFNIVVRECFAAAVPLCIHRGTFRLQIFE